MRQNLSYPGKVITVRALPDQEALPYEGIYHLLIIADSANNRVLVLDAMKNKFLEQIGSGNYGYCEGTFSESEFHFVQGMCHYYSPHKHHCILICDTKNHVIREANLHTKNTRHVTGLDGVRGHDM